jgi:hypothetical protein
MDHAASPSVAVPGPGGAATAAGQSAEIAAVAAVADGPEELGVVTYVHEYLFPLKFLTCATLAIVAVMGALYFAVGFPPAFDTYYEKMYFHGIGIGLAALAVYLVIHVFKLQRYEPPIDFPIVYRAFWAVVSAALGGLVFLNVSVSDSLPDVGVLFFVIAFILMADVGGALFLELFLLPRKMANSYNEQTTNVFYYIGRVMPISKSDRGS